MFPVRVGFRSLGFRTCVQYMRTDMTTSVPCVCRVKDFGVIDLEHYSCSKREDGSWHVFHAFSLVHPHNQQYGREGADARITRIFPKLHIYTSTYTCAASRVFCISLNFTYIF